MLAFLLQTFRSLPSIKAIAFTSSIAQDIMAVEAIKNYPLFKGEAKVREIENRKNFAPDFFTCFQALVN